jgi:hypothetical protein
MTDVFCVELPWRRRDNEPNPDMRRVTKRTDVGQGTQLQIVDPASMMFLEFVTRWYVNGPLLVEQQPARTEAWATTSIVLLAFTERNKGNGHVIAAKSKVCSVFHSNATDADQGCARVFEETGHTCRRASREVRKLESVLAAEALFA